MPLNFEQMPKMLHPERSSQPATRQTVRPPIQQSADPQPSSDTSPAGESHFNLLNVPAFCHDSQPAAVVHHAAAEGIRGPGRPLPFLQAIQRSFGRHDVSHVVAHTGQQATDGAHAMGATAFTTGNHVAFAGQPDLKTAAHEAAHVTQQQAGVQLKGGVGQVGDPYERHADAVAERAAAGQSAEALLDRFAPGTGPGRTPGAVQQNPAGRVVQRNIGFEFQTLLDGNKNSGSGFKLFKHVKDKPDYWMEWFRFNDHETYAKGPDWSVESDGGELEVVTDHTHVTEDLAGKQKLGAIMDDIKAKLDRAPTTIELLVKKVPPEIGEIRGPAAVKSITDVFSPLTMTEKGKKADKDGVRLFRTRELFAHPQVTMGLPINKLLEVMQLLSKDYRGVDILNRKERLAKSLGWYVDRDATKNQEAQRLKQNVQNSAANAKAYVDSRKNLLLTNSLRGFLALIGSYILGGASGGSNNYGKNVTPFMSRSNMASVFESLSHREKLWFRGVVANAAKLSELGTAMGWPADLTKSLFHRGTEESENYVQDETKFSIESWLQDLSKALNPSDKLKTANVFVGFSQMELDGGKTVVELRKLKGDVPLAKWKEFALNAFDLLTLVNQRKIY